ncbi:MAG: helicase-related protein [Anaerolineae bacterium]
MPAPDLSAGRAMEGAFIAGLPFDLTDAQRRVIGEIEADLCRPSPMSRLLQGDVGSGKTAVAGAAAALCAGAGYQAAIMAPTELLADQHLRGLGARLEAIGFARFETDGPAAGDAASSRRRPRYARLVGGMRAGDKAAVAEALRRGDIDIVFGTHALIQDRVAFARLGLAVIDEQHRFGVLQRSTLAAATDGPTPHTLIMTATPIPRTLAHVLNADLEQSVIDALPPGRQPIRTLWLKPDERARAYAFVRQRVGQGEQAYIVCPLVEESERIDSPAATTLHERLQAAVFPDLRLGLLHGRLRPSEKEAVMAAFQAGAIDILVATTVIEVGIDVPNATVMLIDGADRFGLAQLHQLRGRVGRGHAESFCLLLADDPSRGAAERLQAVAATADGLALAERDLALRGPGDYFGTVQAGVVDRFRFARLVGDPGPLACAARVAAAVLERDPDLSDAAHAALRSVADAFAARRARVTPAEDGAIGDFSGQLPHRPPRRAAEAARSPERTPERPAQRRRPDRRRARGARQPCRRPRQPDGGGDRRSRRRRLHRGRVPGDLRSRDLRRHRHRRTGGEGLRAPRGRRVRAPGREAAAVLDGRARGPRARRSRTSRRRT